MSLQEFYQLLEEMLRYLGFFILASVVYVVSPGVQFWRTKMFLLFHVKLCIWKIHTSWLVQGCKKNNENITVSEFNEFKLPLKSPQNWFKLSTGLNLEKFNTILSGTNQIWVTA